MSAPEPVAGGCHHPGAGGFLTSEALLPLLGVRHALPFALPSVSRVKHSTPQ
jgi:hypothetical protein